MNITNEQRKRNNLISSIYAGIIIAVLFGYIFGYFGSYSQTHEVALLASGLYIFNEIKHLHILYPINSGALKMYLLTGIGSAVIGFVIYMNLQRRTTFDLEKSAGDGGFMADAEKKEYDEQYLAKNEEERKEYEEKYVNEIDEIACVKGKISLDDFDTMIMSQNFRRPIIARSIKGNNNVMLVGGAGSGKSYGFMKPNILQMNASFVITDPSGELIKSLGTALQKHGYKIKIFNISDMQHSNCYNPFHYIRDEAGVSMMIDCFINNTTIGEGGGDNQFFVDAEKLIYSACIFFLLEYCHDEDQKNFSSVLNMILHSRINEKDPHAESELDKLFNMLPNDSMAYKSYRSYTQAPAKTRESIVISALTRLRPFMTKQVKNLTRIDQMELDRIGDEKTALFIITPQADKTYTFLASMLYSQLFETLYWKGEQQLAAGGTESLKYPVRCLMDEFANVGTVPDFPSRLATMRKYNISATIALQDIAQLEEMYDKGWRTLAGNCSSYVFLGTQQPDTLKFFSEMLGKETIRIKSDSIANGDTKGNSNSSYQWTGREVMTTEEMSRMDENHCLVYTQGKRPVYDEKYNMKKHPRYSQTADADRENAFLYASMAVYDNSNNAGLRTLLKARQEAARYESHQEEYEKQIGISRPKNAKEEHRNGDLNESFNRFHSTPEEEETAYEYYAEYCMELAVKNSIEEVSIFQVDQYMPARYLDKLLRQLSTMLCRPRMLIFTSVPGEDHYMIGMAVDLKDHLLFRAMDTDNVKEKAESDTQKTVVISKFVYEEYRKEIISNLNFE